MSEPKIVKLRTGAEVPGPMVVVVIDALNQLMNQHPVALFEAVEVARHATHVPFGNTGEILRGYSLIGADGRMHDYTRDVILAAIDGHDEFNPHLVSPYADDSAKEPLA